jgi:hypothetical protein
LPWFSLLLVFFDGSFYFLLVDDSFLCFNILPCGLQPFYALFLSAEMKHNDLWRVGAGENSKEVEFQKNRNRREKETIYQTVQEIPSNPKEPWDIEMDYDDTLTPEIPSEQLPDTDAAETQVTSNQVVNSAVSLAPALSQVGNASTAEPDLELLAVLLKNPELVFALTSGQAGNLSSEDTVKLLDMIKAGGIGLAGGGVNMVGGKVEDKVEVSLPSPTPSSNPGTVCHLGSCCNFGQISRIYCKSRKGGTICSPLCQSHPMESK